MIDLHSLLILLHHSADAMALISCIVIVWEWLWGLYLDCMLALLLPSCVALDKFKSFGLQLYNLKVRMFRGLIHKVFGRSQCIYVYQWAYLAQCLEHSKYPIN
jgi:hypothetical protein